jgi:hypothetical protein
MLLSIATAIGYYLLENAASGIVGQVAYNVLAELYQKHHNKPLVTLYAQAFKRAIDAWKPSLSRFVEPGSTIQVDMPRFKELLQNPQLEISSLSTLNEVELAIILSNNIEQVLMLPGHQLTPYELGDLATRLIRYSAELLIEEIARDENAFRFSVLQEARLAALDRQMVTGLLEKIPISLSTQITMLDYKIDAMHVSTRRGRRRKNKCTMSSR